jgi:hypothetical protein
MMASVLPMLAIPTTRDFPPATVMSLLNTKQLCMEKGISSITCFVENASMGAFDGRNRCVREFLKSPCTHLFWIDSDMSWNAQDFLRILALGIKMPFIAAAYPSKRDTVKFAFMSVTQDNIEVLPTDEYGCVKLAGLGLGFACVQRKVIEQLAAKAPQAKCADDKTPGPQIFRCIVRGGDVFGEDIIFCEDVRALGYDIKIDPNIVLGHVGAKEYRHGSIADTWQPKL